jgi:hypothetical protein
MRRRFATQNRALTNLRFKSPLLLSKKNKKRPYGPYFILPGGSVRPLGLVAEVIF